MRHVLIALISITSVPASAQSFAPAYQGTWARTASLCTAEDARLVVKPLTTQGHESECIIVALKQHSRFAEIVLQCEGEGEKRMVKQRWAIDAKRRLVINGQAHEKCPEVAAAASSSPPVPQPAQQRPDDSAERKMYFGNWMVTIEKDRFDERQARAIAFTTAADGAVLAVRCLSSNISVVVGSSAWGDSLVKGESATAQFRADRGQVWQLAAVAISERLFEFDQGTIMAAEMRSAREYAFRIGYKGVLSDLVIKSGPGADRAIAEVQKQCAFSQ